MVSILRFGGKERILTMKIAVCFFGIPRYFKNGKTLNKRFYDGLQIDYYAHFWNNEHTEKIQSLYKFKKILIEHQIDFSNKFDFEIDLSKTTRDIHTSISPLYSLMRVGELITEDYDFVVLTRTDVVCLESELKKFLQDKFTLYSSYVPGNEWIIDNNDDHIDFKFICSSKENILYTTKLYNNLYEYLKNDKISFCHHRLLAHHLKKKIKNFSMIIGKWYFLRDNNLSEV
jgi:hypothetical protein